MLIPSTNCGLVPPLRCDLGSWGSQHIKHMCYKAHKREEGGEQAIPFKLRNHYKLGAV
jgi:hypothetical protein